MKSERTLVLVKPDGFARGLTGEVLRRIEAKIDDDRSTLLFRQRDMLACRVRPNDAPCNARRVQTLTERTCAIP